MCYLLTCRSSKFSKQKYCMGHTYTTKMIYLKFEFKWALYLLSVIPTYLIIFMNNGYRFSFGVPSNFHPRNCRIINPCTFKFLQLSLEKLCQRDLTYKSLSRKTSLVFKVGQVTLFPVTFLLIRVLFLKDLVTLPQVWWTKCWCPFKIHMMTSVPPVWWYLETGFWGDN